MKLYKVFFLILFSCISNYLKGQEKDSISLHKLDFFTPLENKLWENPLFIKELPIVNYTQTGLYYSHQNQSKLKRVQSAELTSKIVFFTKGIYRFNKIHLFGEVSTQRSYEKNLQYNLTSNRNNTDFILTPHYYFTPRKGKWENQHYNIKGGIASVLLKKIDIAATVNYTTEKFFRTIDPRPEITNLNYGGKIQLGTSIKNHQVYGILGFDKQTTSVEIVYLNDGLVNQEAKMAFSLGYGYIINDPLPSGNSSARNEDAFITKTDKIFGGGYIYKTEDKLFNIQYKYNRELENFYEDLRGNREVPGSRDGIKIAQHRILSHNISAIYLQNKADKTIQFLINYNNAVGDNYNLLALKGQTFKQKNQQVKLQGGYLKKNKSHILFDISTEAVLNKFRVKDFVTQVDKEITTLTLKSSISKDIAKNKNTTWNGKFTAGYYYPLQESLITPSTSNIFIDNVVLPDHGYDVLSKLFLGLNIYSDIQLKKSDFIRIYSKFYNWIGLNRPKVYPKENLSNQLNLQLGILFNY